jgi:methionyl-tRNA formyltransferase
MGTQTLQTVFTGGKQIGVNSVRSLVARNMPPSLIVPNPEDDGTDTWHESLVRVAREANLPVEQGARMKDTKIVAKIKEIRPDIIFAIGSMQLMPPEILSIPSLGVLNIHPALLPKYRGRYSTAHAIFNREKETGVTLHWMDEKIDSGPIILQESYPIGSDDTAKDVYDRFTEVGTRLFGVFLDMLEDDVKIASRKQNESEATYYPKNLPNNGVIDWSWDGEKIRRFVRAMTFPPFPPVTFKLGKRTMAIVDENSPMNSTNNTK